MVTLEILFLCVILLRSMAYSIPIKHLRGSLRTIEMSLKYAEPTIYWMSLKYAEPKNYWMSLKYAEPTIYWMSLKYAEPTNYWMSLKYAEPTIYWMSLKYAEPMIYWNVTSICWTYKLLPDDMTEFSKILMCRHTCTCMLPTCSFPRWKLDSRD